MYHFLAYMARLRHIRRWGLMRSTLPENDAEHSLQVAMMAHALAVIARDRYHRDIDPEHVLALAVYHDATEVITGDMPTPIKYHSDALRGAYQAIEKMAADRLLTMLPASMRPSYASYLCPDQDEAWQLVKAADKLSAYVKCVEEQRAGNHEFDAAGAQIRAELAQNELPEVRDFMAEFVPSFALTLDELNGQEEQA
ncbi:MAG: 5'-deoxynucleotidase [Aristaeellaceae bacterium]